MLHDTFLVALPVAFLVAGALVVALLAFGQAYIQFDAAVFPVQRQRYQGVALAFDLADQAIRMILDAHVNVGMVGAIENIGLAKRLLTDAKNKFVQMGFADQAVETICQERRVGIARDICDWAEGNRADAVIISTRGRSKLAAFFLGETANKVLEYSRTCPVWLVKGTVKEKHAILAIDNSKNALRAVDHAGFMLTGTDVKVAVFHSKRDLKRFLPKEVADEFPELQKFWQRKAGKVILPFIQKAKDMLLESGLREDQITTKLVDGSRSAAADILEEIKTSKAGSLFMGLRGYSNVGDFAMGSVTRKVLNHAENMAVCVVP